MKTKTDKSIDERISIEIKRLNTIFRRMSVNTKKVVKALIENAAFMTITLEDLQEHINENGVTDKYQNGEHQHGVKRSPQVDIHLAMTKNHTQIMKQLTELIPKEQPKQESDGFEEFCNKE
jgi:hypothetical protein